MGRAEEEGRAQACLPPAAQRKTARRAADFQRQPEASRYGGPRDTLKSQQLLRRGWLWPITVKAAGSFRVPKFGGLEATEPQLREELEAERRPRAVRELGSSYPQAGVCLQTKPAGLASESPHDAF